MKYLSIEMSKRLHELNAFAGRAFEVGDWVYMTYPCTNNPWVIRDEQDVAEISRQNEKSRCLFRPRLDDVIDELERLCGIKPGLHPMLATPSNILCQEWFNGSAVNGISPNYLESAAACLIAVLEAKAESKQEVDCEGV